MILSHEEKHSALWLRLKEYMVSELSRHRAKNDGNHDDVTTANIRGRIAILKELSALDEDRTSLADE